ncbi:hypothetical protein N7G274_005696 [Stereocaulon virgatum]|uniref:Uncharacterized protein n=1 Tax=Stereocaulon virgatum TaxID=373712 RepID=A0ABR4A995_9LECA
MPLLMSAVERQSPRAAIQSWLNKTKSDSTAVPNRADEEPHGQSLNPSHRSRREKQGTRPSIANTCHDEHRIGSKCRRDGEVHEAPKRNTYSSILLESYGGEHARYRSRLQPNHSNFAEALGLHAPFRNFRDRDDDPHVKANDPALQRKRRRKASSTTSYLAPAAPEGFADGEDGQQRPDYRLEPNKQTPCEIDDSCSSRRSQRITPVRISLERPIRSYERRPRYKTREDRYDLKEAASGKRKIARVDGDRKKKKQKKHRRREKSGATLMHDFTAQNVTHDRLTLQPAKTLGLFGKGRASSPVKRKGLPDLAFSETAFLKSRRAQAEDPAAHKENMPPPKKSRKSTKVADTAAEMSRYFTTARVLHRDAPRPGDNPQQKKLQRRPMNYDSPPAFIELPDKLFLGFGSCGFSVSPVREFDGQTSKDLRRRLTRSPSRSTSYFTWSQTEFRSQVSRHGSLVPLETSRNSNLGRSSPASAEPGRSNLPVPLPKVPNIFGGYRDAATGITPPSRHCNEALNRTATLLLLDNGRFHSGSHSSEHHQTAEPESNHNERDSMSAEALPVTEWAGRTTTIMKEPRLREQLSSGDIQPCVKLKLREEELGRNAHASVSQTAPHFDYPPSPDPLEMVLEDLLQENKYHNVTDAPPPTTNSLGRHGSMQPAVARPIRSPLLRPQRIELHPRIGEASGSSLPLENGASGLDISGRSQRYQDMKTLGYNTPDSAPTISTHRLRSSNRRTAIDDAPVPHPNPDRSKTDYRNAWNGYNAIYESQQGAADAPLHEDQLYGTERGYWNDEIITRPHSGAATSAYLTYEEEGYPIEMEGRSSDYVPDLRSGQNAVDGERAYTKQGPLHDDPRMNQDQSEGVRNDMEDPLLTEKHYDHHNIGREYFSPGYESAPHQGEIETGYRAIRQQHIAPPFHEQEPGAIHTKGEYHPSLPGIRSSFFIEPPRTRETTAVRGQQDDPALSGFWTPHKLY